MRQWFGEDIVKHLDSWAEMEIDLHRCNTLVNKVVLDVDMLSMGVQNQVVRKSNASLIICADEGGWL